MGEVVDKYARRILQKYRLSPDGWALRQDHITQDLNSVRIPVIGSKTGTLIKLGSGSTKTVQTIVDGDNLYPADIADSVSAEQATFGKPSDCYTFVTDLGKSLTVTPATLIMLADGGAIEAAELVVGKEVNTLDGNEIIVSRTAALAQTVYAVFVNDRPMWYMANGFWIWARDWINTAPAVPPDPLVITTSTPLATGVHGRAYSVSLAGTGGVPPFVWTTADPLPTGLTLGSGGLLSGTPTQDGVFYITIRLTDDRAAAVDELFGLFINPALDITESSPLIGGAQGEAYDVQLTAVGGIPGYTFSLFSGSLPTGLSINGTGHITGTASAQGAFTATIRVTDGAAVTFNKAFGITIGPALGISTSSPLAHGARTAAYSATLTGTGGMAPRTFSVLSGSFPTGLSMSTVGVISGTPTVASVFNFTARVHDSAGYNFDKAFQITVNAELAITTSSPLDDGLQGDSYSESLSGTGGQSPYTWSVYSGALPDGLTLGSGGSITGTPTVPSNFSFVARMTDADGYTVNKSFSILITSLLEITTSALSDGIIDGDYGSVSLTATGGVEPYTWSITAGALPSGMSLSSGGALSGTPTEYGDFSFTVHAADSAVSTDERVLALYIAPTSPHILNGGTLDAATVGVSYSYGMTAGGGVPPRSFSILAGSLPFGLSMGSDGAISGTPSSAGDASFTVRVTDSISQTDDVDCSISVGGDPLQIIGADSLPEGFFASSYSTSVFATGGVPPYFFFVFGGSLPSGVSLNGDGVFYGTVFDVGTFNFQIHVLDNASNEAVADATIVTSGGPG